jgi:hypothetical protein
MLRTVTIITATLAVSIAVTACGGSSSPNKSASTNSGNPGLKIAECMRAHGVPNFPDPTGNGATQIQQSNNGSSSSISVGGVHIDASAPAFQTAMNECQKYAPQPPPISGAQLAALKQGALKMAACMRAHGVTNFPDPVVSTGPGGHGVGIRIGIKQAAASGGALDPNAPAFRKANAICMPLMQSALPVLKAGS